MLFNRGDYSSHTMGVLNVGPEMFHSRSKERCYGGNFFLISSLWAVRCSRQALTIVSETVYRQTATMLTPTTLDTSCPRPTISALTAKCPASLLRLKQNAVPFGDNANLSIKHRPLVRQSSRNQSIDKLAQVLAWNSGVSVGTQAWPRDRK